MLVSRSNRRRRRNEGINRNTLRTSQMTRRYSHKPRHTKHRSPCRWTLCSWRNIRQPSAIIERSSPRLEPTSVYEISLHEKRSKNTSLLEAREETLVRHDGAEEGEWLTVNTVIHKDEPSTTCCPVVITRRERVNCKSPGRAEEVMLTYTTRRRERWHDETSAGKSISVSAKR